MKGLILPLIIFCSSFSSLLANKLLIPMDDSQTNHLKAYGFTYKVLQGEDAKVSWLLNYKGGSFLMEYNPIFSKDLLSKGISYQIISDQSAAQILAEVNSESSNMEQATLQKVPKIALYSPKSASPWDDAVSLALTYAEIPFETIYDQDVLDGNLAKYDWVHLHHEDFTGQMGKMFTQKDQVWYQLQLQEDQQMAKKNGFSKVSQMKGKVASMIKDFMLGGGYLFAMCTATDTFDIALSTIGMDAVPAFYDGDATSSNISADQLNFKNTVAFKDFSLILNYRVNEFSTIDSAPNYTQRLIAEENDFFELNEFSAKSDMIPCILTQNHQQVIHGFMGQTTGFASSTVKSEVTILAENESLKEVKYLYGQVGKGFFAFLGGHDPEDYQHFVNEEHTDLSLHKNSPGYRLILNNILFPSAKKKKQKT
ncbi:asparagine synthetase B [Cytophagaceae bacterium 50C-KIRBA]|uniref:Asparagine synthetase B n=1 Tax=Aquirufa beregesia TaxID=2516556 RepID=A0ABX0EZZ0_9BACT|nr:asparagine synthetase B [Aquirufa beregesia]NGZ43170.1 asparagine synthetase B [Aquirufa beregesia]